MSRVCALFGLLVVLSCTGNNPNYCPSAHDFNCAELDAMSCSPACGGRMPVCGSDLMCHACVAHSDCASNVCLLDGSCSDGTNVAYVDGAGTPGSSCTKAMPCSTISVAIATHLPIVKVTGTVNDLVSISTGTVTILADPMAKLTNTTTGVLFTVSGGVVTIADLEIANASGFGVSLTSSTGTVTLQNVRIDNNSAGGVMLKSGSLTIQQSTLTHNPGPAVLATGGQLSMFRSSVTDNVGGVVVNTARFDLENNFITNNTGVAGLQVVAIPSGQQPARFVFNTLMANSVGSGAAGIDCSANSTLLAFADNIVYGNLTGGSATMQVAGASCTYSFSDVGPGSVVSGTGNLSADPLVVNLGQENDRLTSASPCRDAADLATTVMVDFDGDLRPQGARSDVGADEYYP